MPYNFVTDSFHTKKLCSRLFSSELRFLTEVGHFAFLSPLWGDLEATYDDHLRLIGKRVVNFLLVLIELFSLGVTAEALRANIGSKSAILPHSIGPSTNHSSSQKTRLNGFSYGEQVAQLSQRDRAAGWVSYGQSGKLELGDNIYGLYRSISVSYTHLTLPTNREV